MSRIYELIAELCPDGVEFVELGKLLAYEQPTKYLVGSTAYSESYATPVLTAGQTFVLGRTDETNGIYPASTATPVIIFDDFTTAFKWVDFPFKAKSSAMKMLTPKEAARASLRYIYYVMQTIRYEPQDHARQWIGIYSGFQVPVPPLEVQREIVRILDLLTQLEVELATMLDAELKARWRQFDHYRNEALSFGVDTSWIKLSDVADYTNGKAHEKLADPQGQAAMITARFISRNGEANRFLQVSDILTSAAIGDVAMVLSDLPNGRALARTFYVDRDDSYAINQRVARLRVIDPSRTSSRFLYHYLNRNPGLLVHDNGMDQTHLSKAQVTGLKFPAISLSEQQRIARVLDELAELATGLTSVLSAEITSRRSQFEYHRDKLLTFEEAAA